MSHLKKIDSPIIFNELLSLTQKLQIFYSYKKISDLDYSMALNSLINVHNTIQRAGN